MHTSLCQGRASVSPRQRILRRGEDAEDAARLGNQTHLAKLGTKLKRMTTGGVTLSHIAQLTSFSQVAIFSTFFECAIEDETFTYACNSKYRNTAINLV